MSYEPRKMPVIKIKQIQLHKGSSYDAGARKLVKVVVQCD